MSFQSPPDPPKQETAVAPTPPGRYPKLPVKKQPEPANSEVLRELKSVREKVEKNGRRTLMTALKFELFERELDRLLNKAKAILETVKEEQMTVFLAILADVSSSCHGEANDTLVESLRDLKSFVSKDEIVRESIRVSVTAYGGTVRGTDPCRVDDLQLPDMTPDGLTPMGPAYRSAVKTLRPELDARHANGESASVVLANLTDGCPTDSGFGEALAEFSDFVRDYGVKTYAFGIGDASLEVLERISPPGTECRYLSGADQLKSAIVFATQTATAISAGTLNPEFEGLGELADLDAAAQGSQS